MTGGVRRGGQAATVGQGLCSCRAMPVLYHCVCPKWFKLGVAGRLRVKPAMTAGYSVAGLPHGVELPREIAGVTPDLQGPQWRRLGQWRQGNDAGAGRGGSRAPALRSECRRLEKSRGRPAPGPCFFTS